MVRERNHPAELEAAVRDLWDLRLQGCPREEEVGVKRDVLFHSSQDDFSAPEETGDLTGRDESWDPSLGPEWPTPSVVDTLVICYFACLLLRVPTTLGDIRNWAEAGQMPYRKAVLLTCPSPCLGPYILTLSVVSRLAPGCPVQATGAPMEDLDEDRETRDGLHRPAPPSVEHGFRIPVQLRIGLSSLERDTAQYSLRAASRFAE